MLCADMCNSIIDFQPMASTTLLSMNATAACQSMTMTGALKMCFLVIFICIRTTATSSGHMIWTSRLLSKSSSFLRWVYTSSARRPSCHESSRNAWSHSLSIVAIHLWQLQALLWYEPPTHWWSDLPCAYPFLLLVHAWSEKAVKHNT